MTLNRNQAAARLFSNAAMVRKILSVVDDPDVFTRPLEFTTAHAYLPRSAPELRREDDQRLMWLLNLIRETARIFGTSAATLAAVMNQTDLTEHHLKLLLIVSPTATELAPWDASGGPDFEVLEMLAGLNQVAA